ncbi:MAG: hypothetical protein ACM36C_12080 [Acidobacteriota bacterium]
MLATRKPIALFLATLFTAQCASTTAGPVQTAASSDAARAMLAAAGKIPAGSRVTMELMDGKRFKAVLLAVQDGQVVVQKRTRLPEPALRLDPAQVAYLELDGPREGMGKMLAIGAAIGTGVTLAFLAILAAALGD